MGVGAEQPRTRGGTSQKLGRNDRIWGGHGADRPASTPGWIDRYAPPVADLEGAEPALWATDRRCRCTPDK